MKLSKVEVGPYRNVLAAEVAIEPDITVLVGKNESGKTNLLHALHALNPANGERSFPRLDYPRWLQKKHQRSGEYEDAQPIHVTFTLEPDDLAAVVEQLGEDVLLQDTFKAYRSYESSSFTSYRPQCDEQQAILNVLDGLDVASAPDLASLRKRLSEEAAGRTEVNEPTPEASAAATALARLNDAFGDDSQAAVTVAKLLRARMPRFFYFDDLDQLPGTTDIAPLIEALRTGQEQGLAPDARTALALLRMGYADSELVDQDYEIRKAELQAVSADLTDDVLTYWRQNPHLRLSVDVNPIEEHDPRVGQRIIRRELKLDVEDVRHRFTNSLGSRSSGFRWFISFVAAFAEFETDTNVIVLLDEPGLGLHARAQADFLRFINERLADRHQVIFTTHSPFMVDPARLERVRVVEDAGPDVGTTVTTADGASSDPDTLFPLQAALGYDIAQNLFIGPNNLVVEGLSDFTYLTILSEHLQSLDRTGLDKRWRVLPAGGATNIPTFVALVGPGLDVTVLADGKRTGNQKISNLINKKILKDKRFITVGQACTIDDADIEDLFTDTDYLVLYNAAFSARLKPTALTGSGRLLRRVERAGAGEFDHNQPARHLLHNQAAILPKLSEETLQRFETLIGLINATLA